MDDNVELRKKENSSEKIVAKNNDNEKNQRKNSDDTDDEENLVFENHTKFKLESLLKDFFDKEKLEKMETKFTNDINDLEKDKYSFIFDVVKRKFFYMLIFKFYAKFSF